MKVSPLATTRPDWRVYIKFVEDVCGFSPSTGLGEAYIKVESPSAYLATLDLENQPLNQLRRGQFLNTTFEHVSFSFICALEACLVTSLLTLFSDLNFIIKKGKEKDEWLVIVSATIADWSVAVRRGLDAGQDKAVREFFNNIYNYFTYFGFKEIWSQYNVTIGKDTFITMGNKYA
jgi:hypothetical protein